MIPWYPEFSPQILEFLFWAGCTLAIIYFFSGLDDAFIDVVAFVKKLKPRVLSDANLISLQSLPEKYFAIMVPAWKEGNIISQMLFGNLARLQYTNFHIFVGAYPNDADTIKAVEHVAQYFPNVHAVINHKNGPTSKGQMLNCAVNAILEYEQNTGTHFDAFLMQDAEDLFHPLILKLMNHEVSEYDFVQSPVFSLNVSARQLVAGTYIDEFAEFHTKDILVREALGAAVPSAGVGTALSRRLILGLKSEQGGTVYNESSLTEDYELGLRAHALGYRPHFSCYFYQNEKNQKEFIATREYFPKMFSRSVKQKTRWTIGISLQGWRNLGWTGGFYDRYFLYRDRKGLLTNVASLFGYPLIVTMALLPSGSFSHPFESPLGNVTVGALFIINLFFLGLRLFQKTHSVARVYGPLTALAIPLRWPVGIAINALAVLGAIRTDIQAALTRTKIAWAKTEHELPAYFGKLNPSVEGIS